MKPIATYQNTFWVSAPKISTELLWSLSVVFTVAMLVYFSGVFYFRNRLAKSQNKVRAKKKEFSPMISEFLFYDEAGSKSEKMTYIDLKIQVREMIKSPFDRKVLTEVLMDLRKDVSGPSRQDLYRLYQDLDLHLNAYKKLGSWRWETVSKGIYELTQMNVLEAYGQITRFINDRRSTIRKQAELATVGLKEEGIIFFLDHTKCKISEWQQVKILEQLKNRENFTPPAFRLWLTSPNKDVVLFALRAIKHYQQNDAIASLITLTKHQEENIQKEAILCLREFNGTEAVPQLKENFQSSSEYLKLYLLDALAHLGSTEELAFLKDIAANDAHFTVRNKAITAMNTIAPEAIMPTKDIRKHPEPQISASVQAEEASSTNAGEALPHEGNDPDKAQETVPNTPDIKIGQHKTETMPKDPFLKDELHFLPIVTDTEEAGVAVEDAKGSETSTKVTEDSFSVSFLPLVVPDASLPPVSELPTKAETDSLALAEDVMEETGPMTAEKEKEETPAESIAQVLENMEVVYDIIHPPKPKTMEQEALIDWETAFEGPGEKPKDNNNDAVLDLLFEPLEMEVATQAIPKPELYEEAIMEDLVLLYEIETLGDHREIPFLLELQKTSEHEVIRDRAEKLLVEFEKTAPKVNTKEPKLPKYTSSVFYPVFKNADDTSKELLIKEMLAIGNRKEYALLQHIVSTASGDIVLTAKHAADALGQKLNIPMDTPIKKPMAITDHLNAMSSAASGFDSARGNTSGKRRDALKAPDGNTLFDQLAAQYFKNYGKDNG